MFRALENDLDYGDEPWHGDTGPVPIRRYTPQEMSLGPRALLKLRRRGRAQGRARSQPAGRSGGGADAPQCPRGCADEHVADLSGQR